jgi:hypothetical protein
MNLTSKKASLIILGITAIVLSRVMFLFFNDPEGPNLLVVLGMAAVVYLLSLVPYSFGPSATSQKKLILGFCAQIVILVCFYFFLR